MNKSKTLVVNLIGCPCAGKSTLRAGIFYELKLRGIDCEEAPEYAKDLSWLENYNILDNQIAVFGEQHMRIWRVLGKVDVVITDSPLLLTPFYDSEHRETLKRLALEEFNSMWNYVVYLKRPETYKTHGRHHNQDESKEIDLNIADFLYENEIPFETAECTNEGKDKIVHKILMLLKMKGIPFHGQENINT